MTKFILRRGIEKAKEAGEDTVTIPVLVGERLLKDLERMDERLAKAVDELSAVSEEAFNRVFGDPEW